MNKKIREICLNNFILLFIVFIKCLKYLFFNNNLFIDRKLTKINSHILILVQSKY